MSQVYLLSAAEGVLEGVSGTEPGEDAIAVFDLLSPDTALAVASPA